MNGLRSLPAACEEDADRSGGGGEAEASASSCGGAHGLGFFRDDEKVAVHELEYRDERGWDVPGM